MKLNIYFPFRINVSNVVYWFILQFTHICTNTWCSCDVLVKHYNVTPGCYSRRAFFPCAAPPYSPLSDVVWHGEHVGALRFAGDLAVGEFRSCRAVVPLRPLFSLAGMRAPFASRRCCEGTGDGLRRSGPCARTVVGRRSRSGWPSSVWINDFNLFFIIWNLKWFEKCLGTQICSKFVETNFARFLIIRSTWEKLCMSFLRYFAVEFYLIMNIADNLKNM